jgi:hypothetical protein
MGKASKGSNTPLGLITSESNVIKDVSSGEVITAAAWLWVTDQTICCPGRALVLRSRSGIFGMYWHGSFFLAQFRLLTVRKHHLTGQSAVYITHLTADVPRRAFLITPDMLLATRHAATPTPRSAVPRLWRLGLVNGIHNCLTIRRTIHGTQKLIICSPHAEVLAKTNKRNARGVAGGEI